MVLHPHPGRIESIRSAGEPAVVRKTVLGTDKPRISAANHVFGQNAQFASGRTLNSAP